MTEREARGLLRAGEAAVMAREALEGAALDEQGRHLVVCLCGALCLERGGAKGEQREGRGQREVVSGSQSSQARWELLAGTGGRGRRRGAAGGEGSARGGVWGLAEGLEWEDVLPAMATGNAGELMEAVVRVVGQSGGED